MNVSWWCSAEQVSWSWQPQYYPGIWLVMLALLAGYGYVLWRRRSALVESGAQSVSRAQLASFGGGMALLWIATDWPLGALGAGYLLTAHMVQYVGYSLVIAPLLIRGTPRWMLALLLAQSLMRPLAWLVDRPFLAFVAFNVVLAVTHLPIVADTLKPLQFGQMAIDVIWLVSALVFWAAIGSFDDESEATLAYGKRLLYIIGITLLPTIPGAFFVFSDFPIYTTYEFATRVSRDFSARDDQVLAGMVMWMGMTPILLARLAFAFFAWSQSESRRAGQI